ncbi:MAG: YciI family protein [Acidimicrobiales bacterium]|jgi:uncharacterized protein YciI
MTAQGPDAPLMAQPPAEFDTFQLVVLCRGRHQPGIDEETADRLQAQHLGYLFAMQEAGHMKVAGPLEDQPDERWRGVSVYQVGSLEEARGLAEMDPAVRAGVLEVEAMTWLTPKGTLVFPT